MKSRSENEMTASRQRSTERQAHFDKNFTKK